MSFSHWLNNLKTRIQTPTSKRRRRKSKRPGSASMQTALNQATESLEDRILLTLNPGDVAVVAFNSDGADNFAVAPLVDIPGGTVLWFTDGGVSEDGGNAFTSTTADDILKWTAPGGGVTAGTIIAIENSGGVSTATVGFLNAAGNSATADGTYNTQTGAFDSAQRALSFNPGGDQLAIYETTDDSTLGPGGVKAFIWLFSSKEETAGNDADGDGMFDGTGAAGTGSTTTRRPNGLTVLTALDGTENASTANANGVFVDDDAHAGTGSTNNNNWIYSGTATSADQATWTTRINTLANWTRNDGTELDVTPAAGPLSAPIPIAGGGDVTPPTVTVDIVDSSLSDSDNSSNVTFEFSEDITGFTLGDLTVVGGTVSAFTMVDSDSYTATFTATDGVAMTGSVTVDANSYQDLAANDGAAGSDTVSIDTRDPTTSVALSGGVLTITDIDGGTSDDDLTISHSGGIYTITDNGGLLITTAIAGATGDGTDTVTIPETGVTGIDFDVLGGNDTVTVSSLQASTLTGGFIINGGAGTDTATLNAAISTSGGGVGVTAESINLGADVNSGAGNQNFLGAVTLTAGATLTSTGSGTIDFSSTVDGAFDLVLDAAGGSTITGNVGGIAPLGDGTGAALTVNSDGATEFQGTVTVDSGIEQAINAGTITFRQDITVANGGDTANNFNENVVLDGLTFTTDQDISFGNIAVVDQTTISGGPVIITDGGNGNGVTFNSRLDGGQDLTITVGGSTDFSGSVGGTTPLTSVTVNGAGQVNVNGGGIATSGAQAFTGQVNLGANAIFTGTSGTFTGGIVGGGFDLGLRFSVDNAIPGAGLTGVRNLTAGNGEGGLTIIDGDINTTGVQTYNDDVRIDANTTLTAAGSGVTFNGAVEADMAANNRTVAIMGNAVIGNSDGDAVGANQSLGSLTVSGTTIIDSSAATGITTSGNQTYNDAVIFGQDTTLTGGTVTFNADGDSQTGENNALTITGNLAIGNGDGMDALGGSDAFSSLTVTGTTVFNRGNQSSPTVITTGGQTYTDAASVSNDTVLRSTGSGTIRFMSTLDATASARNMTTETDGSAIFDGVIGGVNPLNFFVPTGDSANVNGTTTINGGAVNAARPRFFNPTTITVDTIITATTSDVISTLNGMTAGMESLTVTGDLQVGFSNAGAIGDATALEFLTVSGATRLQSTTVGAVTTTGLQTYTGAVTVASASTLHSTGGGTVSFGSTVAATGNAFQVTADEIDFGGNVSGTGSLTLAPNIASTTIGVGGGTGTLDLSDADLGFLQDGFSSITIGSATAGDIDIDSATFSDPLTLVTSGEIHDNAGTDINIGTDTMTADGTVAPGQSPGILAITGNFAFADNSTFEVEIGGTSPGSANTDHDQIDATGLVSIGTGVTLDLVDFNGFGSTIVGGESFEIINRTGGTGTFNGLAEGATIANFLGSGLDATLTYAGGDGDDVVLDILATTVTLVGGDLIIDDAAGNEDNQITIVVDGVNYRISDAGARLGAGAGTTADSGDVLVPIASVTGSIQVTTQDGDDTLDVDFSGGNPIPAGGLTFDGGMDNGGGDELTISGNATPFSNQTFNYDDIVPADGFAGDVVLDDGAVTRTITYTGLEPVDGGTSVNTTINLPSGVANDATLQNSTNGGEIEIIDNGATFEDTTFPNPTGSLTVNLGDQGDILQVNTLDAAFAASLIINGGAAATDDVDLTNVTLDTNDMGRGLLVTEVEALDIVGGTITDNTVVGDGGGVLITNSTSGTDTTALLDGVTITDNIASIRGGGLFNDGADITIQNSSMISGNTASAMFATAGGGILNNVGGSLAILNSSVTGNMAPDGFGGGIGDISANSVTLTNVTLDNNSANVGGGLETTTPTAILVTGGTISGNMAVTVGGGLAVGSTTTVIDGTTLNGNTAGGNGGAIISFSALTLQNGTIVTGNTASTGDGGGIFNFNTGALTVDGSTISGNNATTGDGGGIHNSLGADLTLSNTTVISSNTAGGADGDGGGLYLGSGFGTVSITDTTITGNTASGDAATNGGGGIFNDGTALTLDGTVSITNNLANGTSGSGGGIFNSNGGALNLNGTTIDNNSANRAGGGIETTAGANVNLTNIVLTNNDVDGTAGTAAPGNGGGLHVTGAADVLIDGGTITGNDAAAEGGGLWNGTGTMTISDASGNVLIDGNTASGDAADQGGGGIFNAGGTVLIQDNGANTVTISNNDADGTSGSGGGILNDQGTLTVTGAIISANTANRAGGGVETNIGTVTLTDVTLGGATAGDGNTAGINGGGLHVSGAGSTTLNGGRVENNVATQEGGGLWNASGTMTIDGTTISDNSANGTSADQGGGGVFNIGGNLIVQNGATISNNTANSGQGNGGGILLDGGTINVTGSTISNNDLFGISLVNGASGTVTGNTFSGNMTAALAIEGTAVADTISIDATTVTIGANTLNYDTTVPTLSVFGRDGSDTFNVTPSTGTVMSMLGGDPTMGPGDTFNFTAPGETSALTPIGSDGGTYSTTGGFQDVTFDEFETFVFNGDSLTVNSGGEDDLFDLTLAGAGAGTLALTTDVDGTPGPSAMINIMFSGLERLVANGEGGDDVFRQNNTGGPLGLLNGVEFNGGAGSDTLEVLGGTATTVAHVFTNANDGSMGIDAFGLVYTGLEPILDTITATDRTFTFNNTDDDITLSDLGGGRSRIQSVSSSETVDFTNPTASLTINAGDGADTVDASASAVAVTINGGAGADDISGTALVDAINGDAGNDTITGNAGNDVIDGGADDDLLIWNNGDGSDTFDGGAGVDELEVNGSTVTPAGDTITVSANGSRFDLTRADGGMGLGPFSLDVGTIETLDLNTLDGDDSVTVGDLTGVSDLATLLIDAGAGADTVDASALPDLGLSVLIEGGDDNDTLTGSAGPSMINGNMGNDSLIGSAAADTIMGGGGDDVMDGGAGGDMLSGQAGDDTMTGGLGDDTLNGGAETDRIVESRDADFDLGDASLVTVLPGPVVETDTLVDIEEADLNGGAAANTIDASDFSGVATLMGGDNDDTITGAMGDSVVNGNMGNDSLTGLDADDTLMGGGNDDILNGGGGVDMLTGQAGNDTLTGGTGNDVVNGGDNDDLLIWNNGDGSDQMDGGADTDELEVNGSTVTPNGDDITVSANGARFDLTRADGGAGPGPFSLDVGTIETLDLNTLDGDDSVTINDLTGVVDLASIEVEGGDGSDTIDASALPNLGLNVLLEGGNDDDTITGSAGPSAINGNMGNDSLIGGAADDTIMGGGGDDIMNGGAGGDMLTGQAGNDTMTGDTGDDTMNGGADTDLIVESRDADFDLGDASLVTVSPGPVVETDSLVDVEEADLTGGALANTIDASDFSGVATLTGNDGDDTMTGAQGSSMINGNMGNDSLLGLGAVDGIMGGGGNDIIDGGAGGDVLTGQAGNDVINGNLGDDNIMGGDGADLINGSLGNDTISGDAGDDRIQGSNQTDYPGNPLNPIPDLNTLGQTDRDSLLGGAGSDTIAGAIGADFIDGEADADIIDAQSGGDTTNGIDTIIGGAGDIIFRDSEDTVL